MKYLYILFLFTSIFNFAQVPAWYYDTATGNGYTLKTQLKNIISTDHTDQGYGALYTAYQTSDTDSYYEGDGTVLDMYSENPSGVDSYNYNHNEMNCGSYTIEGDCYNREHIFPQGFFNSQYPMKSDIHHVVPSDGRVNGFRGNYPFGEVGTNLISQSNITNPTSNGSKVGNCIYPGYSGIVFEPIDEFKGDIARMLFYFAVRYEDEVTSGSWDAHTKANNPLNGTNDQVYETWYINLLYDWHIGDPVSQRDIDRNDAAYTYQGNRNPFIDHPEYVINVWGNLLSTPIYEDITSVSIYPNPVKDNFVYFSYTQNLDIIIYDVLGKQVIIENITPAKDFINISNLNKGIYLVKIISNHGAVTKKLIIQ